MRKCSKSSSDTRRAYLRELGKMTAEEPAKRGHKREPPMCGSCPFSKVFFRYRKCFFADCPYGKSAEEVLRKRPLRGDLTRGGGDMHV